MNPFHDVPFSMFFSEFVSVLSLPQTIEHGIKIRVLFTGTNRMLMLKLPGASRTSLEGRKQLAALAFRACRFTDFERRCFS
jgi:hypothetical protein